MQMIANNWFSMTMPVCERSLPTYVNQCAQLNSEFNHSIALSLSRALYLSLRSNHIAQSRREVGRLSGAGAARHAAAGHSAQISGAAERDRRRLSGARARDARRTRRAARRLSARAVQVGARV